MLKNRCCHVYFKFAHNRFKVQCGNYFQRQQVRCLLVVVAIGGRLHLPAGQVAGRGRRSELWHQRIQRKSGFISSLSQTPPNGPILLRCQNLYLNLISWESNTCRHVGLHKTGKCNTSGCSGKPHDLPGQVASVLTACVRVYTSILQLLHEHQSEKVEVVNRGEVKAWVETERFVTLAKVMTSSC